MKKIFFDTLPSTNLYLKENYNSLDNLTLVYTNHQTEGRGRLGRTWIDGDDLLFSILIKDNITKPTDYTFLMAITFVNVLKKYNLNSSIKWPNDIIVNKKKISGILLEGISEEKPKAIIIGCGLNTNTTSFPKEIFFKATSMTKELKVKIDKEKLLDEIIIEFESLYNSYINNKLDLFNLVRNNLYAMNKVIRFVYDGLEQIGSIKGIDNEGRLLVNTRGNILHLTSGEITLHNEY